MTEAPVTNIIRIGRDATGIYFAHDVDMKRDIKNAAGSPCLSDGQAKKIAERYEARGFTIEWVS